MSVSLPVGSPHARKVLELTARTRPVPQLLCVSRQLQWECCSAVIARFCALAVERGIATGSVLPSARRNSL